MDKAALQALQAPLKEQYRDAPEKAFITLSADPALDVRLDGGPGT